MNLTAYRDGVLRMVKDVSDVFERPTDDWQPFLFFHGPKVSGIIPFGDAMEELHDAVPALVYATLRAQEAVFAAWVCSAWLAFVQPDEIEGGNYTGLRARDRADRREVVVVNLSDGQTVETWHADIVRTTDAPPTLAEWKEWNAIETTGGVAPMLLAALNHTPARN